MPMLAGCAVLGCAWAAGQGDRFAFLLFVVFAAAFLTLWLHRRRSPGGLDRPPAVPGPRVLQARAGAPSNAPAYEAGRVPSQDQRP
ncbi:hypothetical protein GO308_12700 [Sphingomonas sp. SFZ2018-12]|uniref:hypothetical protein n=1 Tax=Sphingomonas sp. SFZ2018-12 TaxID=2683197 RepID=UPI001F0E8396|nr:hypothetical protein [Sphingomonas sp. SFZ2018-12]MCH4893974.1 hypothetical protein [Sphingomonas sp. SFZ2018-12]